MWWWKRCDGYKDKMDARLTMIDALPRHHAPAATLGYALDLDLDAAPARTEQASKQPGAARRQSAPGRSLGFPKLDPLACRRRDFDWLWCYKTFTQDP